MCFCEGEVSAKFSGKWNKKEKNRASTVTVECLHFTGTIMYA